MRARCSTWPSISASSTKSGAWFTYEGEQLGQGRENAKNFLTENPEVMVEVSDKVMVACRPAARSERTDRAGGRRRPTETFTEADEQPIELD